MVEVDARGLPCPQPVITTKKALDEIEEGTVTVLVDSAESSQNVRRFAHSQRCQVEVTEREGVFYLEIVKGHPAQAEPERSGDVVFIIGSDRLGTGDTRAGEILMKSFLNTLGDTEPKPAKLIFLNSGVRLATEGSEVLEALQLLEKHGVRILSCGACLEYYHLKLGAGLVTNMYDTVNSLLAAAKVITI